ncbi:MAG: hypothetical protein ACYC2H_08540 [Thermoplasmatota archaeon]
MGLDYAVEKYTDAVLLLASSDDMRNRLSHAAWEVSHATNHIPTSLAEQHRQIVADLNQISGQSAETSGTTPATVDLLSEEERDELAGRIVWFAMLLAEERGKQRQHTT